MTLVEKIRVLARQRDMSLPQLEIELGFGNGTISRWKTSSPNTDKLLKIARYFHVSIDSLLERDDLSSESSLTAKDERDIARDMEALREKLMNNEAGPASYDGDAIPEEDAELLLGQIELMMRRLKPINKEKYNPNKNKK